MKIQLFGVLSLAVMFIGCGSTSAETEQTTADINYQSETVEGNS